MRAFLLGGVLLLAGCRDTPTQTWVFIHADPAFAPSADRLRVTIEAQGEEVLARTEPAPRDLSVLANLYLVPRDGDATRTWAIHAELLEGEATVAHLRVGGGYEAGETRVVHAHFETDAQCVAAGDCGPGRTCQAGRCVGACFTTGSEEDDTTRHLAVCGECARCVDGRCDVLADGTACGCEGDRCLDGRCDPAVDVLGAWTGDGHACARTDDGLWCWGASRTNQTTHGADTDRPAPVDDPKVRGVRDMALGVEWSCGSWIRSGPTHGRSCWGWASSGSFAMGELGGEQPILEVTDTSEDTIVDIAAGRLFQCARRESGLVQCAGSNDSNQLARPDTVGSADEWVDIPGRYEELSVAPSGVCARNAEGIFCWGMSTFDADVRSPELTCVAGDDGGCVTSLRQIAAGEGRGCALDDEGRAHCWGTNTGGTLGVDGPERVASPMPVDTDVRFRSLATSGRGFCGIAVEGGLYCWGGNDGGQLGVGTRSAVVRPMRVQADAGDEWLEVAMAFPYTCAIRSDEQLFCWGSNAGSGPAGSRTAGRLGLGLGTDPVEHDVYVTRPRRVCFDRE